MKYDNTNRGALFRNDDKTDDKHADYRGSVNVEGTEYWINAWINEFKEWHQIYGAAPEAEDGSGKGKRREGKRRHRSRRRGGLLARSGADVRPIELGHYPIVG